MVHILVLEDDAKLNQLVCTYLNDSGFAAKGCLRASDAYDELYNSLYDLIISDIMMPEIDGFAFARTVRQVNKRIPILFMSARDDLPAKQKGFQLGIDDYMVKPIELDELLLRVPGVGVTSARRILAARRAGPLTFEGLKGLGVVLNRAQYFLTCSGRMLPGLSRLSREALLARLTAASPALPPEEAPVQLSLFH